VLAQERAAADVAAGRGEAMGTEATMGREDDLDEKAGAFVGRLFDAGLGGFDLLTVYLGDRLGLYRQLAEKGSGTPDELARRAGIHPRYAREWLEQQAVSGILEVDDTQKPADQRRYSLPAAHAEALTKPDSLFSISPVARALVSATQALPQLLRAFRTGEGVAWSAYGSDMIESQGDFNRPWLVNLFGAEFLPAIPDVHQRLLADPPARVVDVACGVGWAAIAIAKSYPKVNVDGFDPDESSIDEARRLAKESGVDDRVRFEVRDGEDVGKEGPYDLAVVVEAIHDVSRRVHCTRRRCRALHVRGECSGVPPGWSRRAALGCYRDGDARRYLPGLRNQGGVPGRGGPSVRARVPAVLPAHALNRSSVKRGRPWSGP